MVMKIKDAIASGTITVPQSVIDAINAAETGKAQAATADATQVASLATANAAVAQNQADQAAAAQAHANANQLAGAAVAALKAELGIS